jgi:hypothetical protein
VRNKRSALRHKNNGATAIPHSELHLALDARKWSNALGLLRPYEVL